MRQLTCNSETTQQTNGASHQGEDSPEVPDATSHQPLDTEMANLETVNSGE